MPVIFKEKEHLYLHEGKKLESVTTLLKKLSSTDWDLVKERYAKKHKMTVDEVTNKWNKSAEVGTLIHAKFEKEIYNSTDKSYVHENVEEGKLAFDLKTLEVGNYPELIIYSNYYKIAGQSDLVVIHEDKTFEIEDYKTDKEITFKGSIFFNSKKRVAEVQKFKNPVSHLDDVNWNKYQLQLSIYAYILERQGYKLKFKPDHTGIMKPCLTIKHVVTERCDDGSHYLDETNNPVIQDVILYTCEYLKDEASKILEAYKWAN